MNLNDLTDEVQSYLRSFTKDQETATFVTADIKADDLIIPVADANYVSRGRMQIDNEIVWVDSVDRTAKTATVPPYGRGMDGTTATAHTKGAQLINNPLYPRHQVAKTINQIITALGADLYAINKINFQAKTLGYAYEMPEDTRNVLSISYIAVPASYKFPTYAKHWTWDPDADPSVAKTGKCVYIYDAITPLYRYTVTYAGWPKELPTPETDFSESGLPATSYDVVILGAASRLLSLATAAMIQSQSVEANVVDQKADPTSAINQSKYLFSLYQNRLQEERLRLLNTTANRSRYQR